MLATSVNDEEMAVPKPSIRTVIATIATVGIVMGLWVSSTLVLDLIFHFHRPSSGWPRVGCSEEWVAPHEMLGRHWGSPVLRAQQ